MNASYELESIGIGKDETRNYYRYFTPPLLAPHLGLGTLVSRRHFNHCCCRCFHCCRCSHVLLFSLLLSLSMSQLPSFSCCCFHCLGRLFAAVDAGDLTTVFVTAAPYSVVVNACGSLCRFCRRQSHHSCSRCYRVRRPQGSVSNNAK